MTTEAKFSIVVKDKKKGYTKKCTMTVCIIMAIMIQICSKSLQFK